MHTLTIDTRIEWNPTTGTRACEWARMFGLRLGHFHRRLHCRMHLAPGYICFVSGPSGCGKSMLLKALYEQIPSSKRMRLEETQLEADTAVIDCFPAASSGIPDILKIPSKVGLADDRSLLTPPARLSSGQQWRYRLARMLASSKPWLFADDFTALLDRISACVLAYHLRKRITQTQQILVLASCHDDMLADLQPDVLVTLSPANKAHIIYTDADE